MSPHSDKELTQQLRENNERAFESLYLKYFNKLYEYAWRLIKDDHASYDVVQDVFLKVWNIRSELNPELSTRAFLFTLVRNKSFDYLKKVRRIESYSEYCTEIEDYCGTSESEMEFTDLENAYSKALNKLPPGCRRIFILKRHFELTYKEIAEIEGVSVTTVQTQIGRALKSLRHQLTSFFTSILPFF